jgi:hypothetical protein
MLLVVVLIYFFFVGKFRLYLDLLNRHTNKSETDSCDYETIDSVLSASIQLNNDFSSISDFLFDFERQLTVQYNHPISSPNSFYLEDGATTTSLNNLLKSESDQSQYDKGEEDTGELTEEFYPAPIMNYNYRDFCGSQEWDLNQMKKHVNSPYYHLVGQQQHQQQQQQHSKCFSARHQINSESALTQSSFYLAGDFAYPSLLKSSSSFHQVNSAPPATANITTTLTTSTTTSTTNQEYMNDEFTNFYHSSLISDYRLTLTDLIDLNLIDISSGLIINPLNGCRLTVADAIRIDLLNSDVKEIANTFMNNNNETSCFKLTVKEAIKLAVLNPFRNEIHLSATNVNLKLNLHDARKRNLILKPLTLSDAFIRNLIQPNGFVRNPINNKYYSFETLIANDSLNSKHIENPYYMFDFETKHIIDPNDPDKKLFSLSEAIQIGLILPHSFELNLNYNMPNSHHLQRHKSTKQHERINLYDAFFNSQNMNLSLLLYKPEIENVYIRLAHSVKSNNSSHHSNKNNSLAILLSRREKIGLIEAMNLNVVNLKHKTYSILNETVISLDEAAALYKTNKLIDSELIDLLNSPIGMFVNDNVTVLDCINDNTLILERFIIVYFKLKLSVNFSILFYLFFKKKRRVLNKYSLISLDCNIMQ